jgi:hypothetical protein
MIYVSCGGHIEKYKNIEEVIQFYKECAACSEGSERSRYMSIIVDALSLNGKEPAFITDGMRPFGIDFDPSTLSPSEIRAIMKGFGITKSEIDRFKKDYEERRNK